MEYEKLKKNNVPTDQPLLEKQGRERGNKNIFKDGPNSKIVKILLKKIIVFLAKSWFSWCFGGQTT